MRINVPVIRGGIFHYLFISLSEWLVFGVQYLQKLYKLGAAATCKPQLLTTNILLVITLLSCFCFSTEQAVALEKTIYLTLTYISSLFDEDSVPDQWQKVEVFQNIIDRQIEENQCVRQGAIGRKT